MRKSIASVALLASMFVAASPLIANAQYGGGGGGPPVGIYGVSFGSPAVLGASTTTVPQTSPTTTNSCSALLTSYLRYGKANNSAQVTKLQSFLKTEGYTVTINGTFDLTTLAAVKQFQLDHAAQILTPWGITQPTGFVYKTTLWEINHLYCGTLNVPAPQV